MNFNNVNIYLMYNICFQTNVFIFYLLQDQIKYFVLLFYNLRIENRQILGNNMYLLIKLIIYNIIDNLIS